MGCALATTPLGCTSYNIQFYKVQMISKKLLIIILIVAVVIGLNACSSMNVSQKMAYFKIEYWYGFKNQRVIIVFNKNNLHLMTIFSKSDFLDGMPLAQSSTYLPYGRNEMYLQRIEDKQIYSFRLPIDSSFSNTKVFEDTLFINIDSDSVFMSLDIKDGLLKTNIQEEPFYHIIY
jgi:hypothetical protein